MTWPLSEGQGGAWEVGRGKRESAEGKQRKDIYECVEIWDKGVGEEEKNGEWEMMEKYEKKDVLGIGNIENYMKMYFKRGSNEERKKTKYLQKRKPTDRK